MTEGPTLGQMLSVHAGLRPDQMVARDRRIFKESAAAALSVQDQMASARAPDISVAPATPRMLMRALGRAGNPEEVNRGRHRGALFSMARAFRAFSERVEQPEDRAAALKSAHANPPAAVDVVASRTIVSSDMTQDFRRQPISAWDDPGRQRRSPC